ncbi:MAG: sigma-70 family RNA polymerase sigma factor [Polyangiaceae bacterium]
MGFEEGKMVKALARVDAATDEADAISKLIAEGQYKEALARCARAYAGPLGRLCMALTGSQAEAEELVQETFIAAYDSFPTFRFESPVRSWLYGIARRICGRHNEMKNRRQARLRLVHDTGRGVDAGELALERERAIRARTALARLKPSEREAVVLRYDAGLSFREVAEACGVDEAAARKRVSRALMRMRESLTDV